jgi:hypothetical protein
LLLLADVKRQTDEAPVIGCPFAGQLRADVGFDHAVGEVALHDRR